LENLNAEVDWETIRENIKISAKKSLGYFEFKKHKPWFNKGCSRLLDQRKEAKLQLLQDPSEINGDNLNNVRLQASRYFRNKKREYLKDKINELNFWVMHPVARVPIKHFFQTSVRNNICSLMCITSTTCFGPDRWPSPGDS
jgi:hypothetical protein